MVHISNANRKTVCFGVILKRDRVAFPQKYWQGQKEWAAVAYCCNARNELHGARIPLGRRVPEEMRLYLAEGIMEVEVSSIGNIQCF